MPLALALALTATSLASAQACEDDALSLAASELLQRGGEPTGDALRAAARRAGSDAPTFRALAIRDGDDARRGPWLAELAQRLRAPLACGEARSDERILVVAAPRAGRIDLDRARPGRVRVALAAGFTEPMLYVEDASGATQVLAPARDGVVDLPADLRAPIRLQLVARGPDGPRPVAERTLGDASEADEFPTGLRGRPLADRIDALRARAGVAALRPNRLLDSLAREHAERVCRQGRAAHELEPGRDPPARLRERGLRARHAGEVVARGPDAEAALAALTRSPSHRAALVDARMTDAGAGLASDARGGTCLVVLLAAWPRRVGGTP